MRNNTICQLRVFAMLMVVFYHSICFYSNIWEFRTDFHLSWAYIAHWLNGIDMIMFVFASGFLYRLLRAKGKYQNNIDFIKSKGKRLLLPYTIFGCGLLFFCFSRYDFLWFCKGLAHLWFLLMLFVVFLIALLSNKKWDKFNLKQSIIYLFIILFISICVTRCNIRLFDYLCISSALKFIPYFYLGYMVCQYKLELNIGNIISKFIFVVILYSIFIYFQTLGSHIPSLIRVSISLLMPYLKACLMFYIYCFIKKLNIPSVDIINRLDKNSMGIYLIHHILLYDIFLRNDAVAIFMSNHYIFAPCIVFLVILIFSYLVSDLIKRTPLNFLIG